MDERHRQWRARVLGGGVLAAFSVIALTLVSMQVLRHDYFAGLARENRQYHRRVLAPRGIISDRNGVQLAHNLYQARITYPRDLVREGNSTLDYLLRLLGLDHDSTFERMSRPSPGDRVTVVRRASPEQVAVVEEHRPQLPHVQLTVEPRRRYRFGSLAAHVMGYVGEVRGEEIARGTPYQVGDVIGRRGVEQYAEDQLRGRHGRRVVEVNANGHIVGEVPEGSVPVLPGVQIYLTLHHALQTKLEGLLDGSVGAGVVMEVSTGDVLAAASAPTYDPNEFTRGLSAERYEEIRSNPRKPEFNRCFQGTYPPGSPFKVITAAAALERGRVTPDTRFDPCWGSYRFGNRDFGCWDPHGHGSLDLEGAIVQSCDVYFYQLAQRLSVDELAETARRFGLGSPTGLPSFHDLAGLVPTRQWYDEKEGPGRWTQGVLLNLSIGQGEFLVTPLQLARTYAAIGGDGHLYRPHLVLARENAFGVRDTRRVVRTSQPICSPRVQRFLQRSLNLVVHGEEGTGGLAQVAGVSVSGKTGTAENPFGEDHAWFVAYAPSENPEVAVAVIVENSGHGGAVAAPIVGELLHEYFELQAGASRADLLGKRRELGR